MHQVPLPQDLAHDLYQFIDTAKSFMALLLTSTAVQTVVTNTIILVQEVITEFAGSVSDVPRQVQGVAEGVEKKLDAEVDVPPYPTSRIYPLSSKRRLRKGQIARPCLCAEYNAQVFSGRLN